MPPRSVIVAVVVLWLAVMAWLVKREVWPRLAPGEPPPFALDLLDSSQPRQQQLPARWRVTATRGEKDVLDAIIITSTHHHPGTDVLDLRCRLEPKGRDHLLKLGRLDSSYRVDIRGRMLGLDATARMLDHGPESHFRGDVRDGVCELIWSKTFGSRGGKVEIETPLNGLVLLPLHPLHRMEGLRPGRTWGVHLLDPLDNVGLASGPKVVWVHAEVGKQDETLYWQGRDRRCRVVNYRGDNGGVKGTVWVGVDADLNFLVLRLRMDLGDTSWNIERE